MAALHVKLAMAADALPGTAPDVPVDGQPWNKGLGFQVPATEIKVEIEEFHNYLLWIITAITIVVLVLMLYIIVRFNKRMNPIPSKTSHNTLLEVIWTAIPVAILVAVVIPSFKLLFFADHIPERAKDALPPITLRAIGHQWYWSYEFPDYKTEPFDSRMIPEADWQKAYAAGKATGPRLLAVDAPVLVPVNRDIRVLTASEDVIHAFAIPAFGIKKDAVPGRNNEMWFNATKTGMFYGQCSELCGADHGYMPIAVKVVSQAEFDTWVNGLEKTEAAAAESPAGETPATEAAEAKPADADAKPAEAATADAPKADEQKADEPKADDAKADEPKPTAPDAEKPADAAPDAAKPDAAAPADANP